MLPPGARPPLTHLFVLHAYGDVDHIAPLIWKCLTKGDRTLVIFDQPYAHQDDYRIRFLQQDPGFSILSLLGPSSRRRAARLASRLVWGRPRLRRLLARENVDTLVVDWGPGVEPASLRDCLPGFRPAPQSGQPRGRLLGRALRPLRSALILAALDRGVPAVCVPNGVRLRLNPSEEPDYADRPVEPGGTLPREGRDCFATYVLTSELDREFNLKVRRMDPGRTEAWGSLRFSPEWIDVLGRICPPVALPPVPPGQVRVVFMVPKPWPNVRVADSQALLESLAGRRDVQLVVKTHPRPGSNGLDAAAQRRLGGRPNVVMADAHSHALIRSAAVVVVVDSGVALDALLLGKPLLYPSYLHQSRLIFDECGGCVIARSAEAVHDAVAAVARGTLPRVDERSVAAVLRSMAYADRPAFDVPEYYHARLRAIAEGRSRSAGARPA